MIDVLRRGGNLRRVDWRTGRTADSISGGAGRAEREMSRNSSISVGQLRIPGLDNAGDEFFMKLRIPALILILAASLAADPSLAEIRIEGAYARSAGPSARAGAAFMVIRNTGGTDDRLVSVSSDASSRVELHTHIMQDDGVMRMMKAEDGFTVPAGGSRPLGRGGDHVMFLGLKGAWMQGDLIPLTLVFENAGELALEVAVDLVR